jgi:hypothetical protein
LFGGCQINNVADEIYQNKALRRAIFVGDFRPKLFNQLFDAVPPDFEKNELFDARMFQKPGGFTQRIGTRFAPQEKIARRVSGNQIGFIAQAEQTRIKKEFQTAFAENLVCRGFERSETAPKYLLFENED